MLPTGSLLTCGSPRSCAALGGVPPAGGMPLLRRRQGCCAGLLMLWTWHTLCEHVNCSTESAFQWNESLCC